LACTPEGAVTRSIRQGLPRAVEEITVEQDFIVGAKR
jgi:hypothetical protein